jgi:hypothetical protein
VAKSEPELQCCHEYALAAGREDVPATRLATAAADTHPAGMCCNLEEGSESENLRPEAAEAATGCAAAAG